MQASLYELYTRKSKLNVVYNFFAKKRNCSFNMIILYNVRLQVLLTQHTHYVDKAKILNVLFCYTGVEYYTRNKKYFYNDVYLSYLFCNQGN